MLIEDNVVSFLPCELLDNTNRSNINQHYRNKNIPLSYYIEDGKVFMKMADYPAQEICPGIDKCQVCQSCSNP